MRILAIDYGQARMGLALSDELGLFAFPYVTLSGVDFVSHIAQICEKENVSQVVVGDPITHAGEAGQASQRVREFAVRLREGLLCPVTFENERFSTALAIRNGARDPDTGAACVILQSYLDRMRRG